MAESSSLAVASNRMNCIQVGCKNFAMHRGFCPTCYEMRKAQLRGSGGQEAFRVKVLDHDSKNLEKERIEPRSFGGRGFPAHLDISTVAGFNGWAVLDENCKEIAECETAPRTFYVRMGGSNDVVELDATDPIGLHGDTVEGSYFRVVEFTKEVPCMNLDGVTTPRTPPMCD